jgi:hypothetical protein
MSQVKSVDEMVAVNKSERFHDDLDVLDEMMGEINGTRRQLNSRQRNAG